MRTPPRAPRPRPAATPARAPAASYCFFPPPPHTGTNAAAAAGLSGMFRPPSYLFRGTFEMAKAAAAEKDRWLVVNVVSDDEFASHQLNRDTWKHDAVSAFLSAGFVFLQARCRRAGACRSAQHAERRRACAAGRAHGRGEAFQDLLRAAPRAAARHAADRPDHGRADAPVERVCECGAVHGGHGGVLGLQPLAVQARPEQEAPHGATCGAPRGRAPRPPARRVRRA